MKQQFIGVIIFTLCAFTAHAQKLDYPVVGAPCPEFILNGIRDYPVDRLSSTDLNGRYVILDFWHRYCASCIASFPKMNELAKQFKGKVEIFMVGLEDEIGLDGLVNEMQKRYGLDHLTFAIDSALFNRFVPRRAAPLIVLIDDKGSVKHIASSINEEMVEAFYKGEDFEWRYRSGSGGYDKQKPFLLEGNGEGAVELTDVRSRSMLLDYRMGDMPVISKPASLRDMLRFSKKNWFDATASLPFLYQLAYYGRAGWGSNDSLYSTVYYDPILEIGKDDSTFFQPEDYTTGENLFWYSLILPKERWNEQQIMLAMQEDLRRTFGLTARVEVREMPYWKVTATDDVMKKLTTKGGKPMVDDFSDAGVKYFRNVRFDKVILNIFKLLNRKTYPIVGDTSINESIDLEFHDTIGLDFELARKELERHGIYMTLSRKPFKVLVIQSLQHRN